MDTLSLRLFLTVAKFNSVSAAARELSLSAASASARLAKLEEQSGFRLFNRTTRAVSLTTDGAAFLPFAQQSLETLEAGLCQTKGKTSEPKGVLRMAMPGSFGRMHIIPRLAAFQRQFPQVNLDLRLSDQIQDPVAAAYDLIIRNAHLADSSFVARKLAPDERILVASPSYVGQHGSPDDPQQLLDHPCVNLAGNHRWEFENGQTITTPANFVADDGEAVRMMIEQGLGIGMKSLWNAHAGLREGRLVRVLEDFPLVTKSNIWALYPSGRLVAPKVRIMIDFLVTQFQPHAPWDCAGTA